MQFLLVSSSNGQKIYCAWQYNLKFLIARVEDPTIPDTMSCWDYDSNSLLFERDIPKPIGDISFFTSDEG